MILKQNPFSVDIEVFKSFLLPSGKTKLPWCYQPLWRRDYCRCCLHFIGLYQSIAASEYRPRRHSTNFNWTSWQVQTSGAWWSSGISFTPFILHGPKVLFKSYHERDMTDSYDDKKKEEKKTVLFGSVLFRLSVLARLFLYLSWSPSVLVEPFHSHSMFFSFFFFFC